MLRRPTLLALAAAMALGALTAADAFAQSPRRKAAPEREKEQEEATARPARQPRIDRGARLDGLFEALKISPTPHVAQSIEQRIEAMLLQSGSATADLLMARARTLIEAKEYDVAIQVLDALIEIEPNFTEAYAQRATVHYIRKELALSLADLRVVLAREPRHFTALSGLGVIMQDIGAHKQALEAFRRAIAVHPHLKAIPEFIKRLEVRVEGREI